MNEGAKSGAVTKSRRRHLTFGERLRGWVEVATWEELRDERRSTTRRAIDVVKALAHHGIRVRPIAGVEVRLEAAEKLIELLNGRHR
jgi:hypothetical protein